MAASPTLAETLIAIWQQVLAEHKPTVEIGRTHYPVGVTRSSRLKTVEFTFRHHHFAAIEQNPETSSRWAALARGGRRIMQFNCGGRYVANVCDGKLTRYPAWRSLNLPD